MSVTVSARVFWTKFNDLTLKKGEKTITVSKSVAKLVLLAIADNADDFGENSYQSFETLATKSSIERRSVIRAIQVLIANDYLQINGKSRYGTNDYKVNLKKLGHAPDKRACVGRPKIGDSDAKIGDSSAEISDSDAKIGDRESPDPSFNPSVKHPLRRKRANVFDEANRTVDAILEQERQALEMQARGKGWPGRASCPPDLLPLADCCVRQFGAPVKRDLMGWIAELGDWHTRHVTTADFDASIAQSKSWTVPPISPYSLTRTIIAIAQARQNKPVQTGHDIFETPLSVTLRSYQPRA
jgi:hypothetical protein